MFVKVLRLLGALVLFVITGIALEAAVQLVLRGFFPSAYRAYNDLTIGRFDGSTSAVFSVESATAVALWIATFAVLALKGTGSRAALKSRSRSEQRLFNAMPLLRRYFVMQWFSLFAFTLLPPFMLAVVELMPFVSGKMVAVCCAVVFLIVISLFYVSHLQLTKALALIDKFFNGTQRKLTRWKRWYARSDLAKIGQRQSAATKVSERIERQIKLVSAANAQNARQFPVGVAALIFNALVLLVVGVYPRPGLIAVAVLAQIIFAWGLLLLLAIELLTVEQFEDQG